MEKDIIWKDKVIKLSKEEKKMEWNLYVLRYHYSGNYYVGTTIDFEDRMLDHWRKTSTKGELPQWSLKNKSTKGFEFYWFNINQCGVSQGKAEHCENQLAKLLVEKIEDINGKKFTKEVHVGNGKFVDGKEDNYDIEIKVDDPPIDIDEEIKNYLKELKSLEPKNENEKFSIKCIKIGNVGEYDHSQREKKWYEVETIEFES